jgi:hypothetical protein
MVTLSSANPSLAGIIIDDSNQNSLTQQGRESLGEPNVAAHIEMAQREREEDDGAGLMGERHMDLHMGEERGDAEPDLAENGENHKRRRQAQSAAG